MIGSFQRKRAGKQSGKKEEKRRQRQREDKAEKTKKTKKQTKRIYPNRQRSTAVANFAELLVDLLTACCLLCLVVG